MEKTQRIIEEEARLWWRRNNCGTLCGICWLVRENRPAAPHGLISFAVEEINGSAGRECGTRTLICCGHGGRKAAAMGVSVCVASAIEIALQCFYAQPDSIRWSCDRNRGLRMHVGATRALRHGCSRGTTRPQRCRRTLLSGSPHRAAAAGVRAATPTLKLQSRTSHAHAYSRDSLSLARARARAFDARGARPAPRHAHARARAAGVVPRARTGAGHPSQEVNEAAPAGAEGGDPPQGQRESDAIARQHGRSLLASAAVLWR